MFSQKKNGNFGQGISSLSNSIGFNRKTEVTNYMNDFANVKKYQEMMAEMNQQQRKFLPLSPSGNDAHAANTKMTKESQNDHMQSRMGQDRQPLDHPSTSPQKGRISPFNNYLSDNGAALGLLERNPTD